MSAATLSSLRHLLTRRLGGASIQPLRCALIGHALIYQPITPSLLTHSFARRILATWEPLANAGTAACARQLPKLSTRQAVLALGIGTVSSLGFRSSADCELAPPALLGPTLPTPIAEAPTYAGQQPLPLLNRLLQRLFYLARALYLWCVFCPLLLSSPLAFWQTRFPTLEELWWRCCVKTLERTGALVIKLAQWASSRPDLFGERTCARVEHLQDRTPPHALRETEATLDAMFGTEWRQKLKIDPEPLGSGCIAQVHKGQLLVDGVWTPVAVKVIHPRVDRYIDADAGLLEMIADSIQALPRVRWLNPGGMAREFTKMLKRQLDLRQEALNLDRFHANFATTNSGAPPLVDFPTPMYPFVSREALVESFIDGEPMLRWAARLPVDAQERQEVCNAGIDAFCQMLFVHNFVHGDLHPGNVFITTLPDGTPRLAFLDAGIVVEYSDFDHGMLIDILGHFMNYEGYEGGQMMIEQTAAQSDVTDADGFCKKIAAMVEMARDTPTFFDQIGACISIICNAACDHRVKIHEGFISIALSVKVVEGVVIQVDPAAVVAPRAKAVVVREHIKRKGRNLLGRSPFSGKLIGGNNDSALRQTATESSNMERKRRADLQAERANAELRKEQELQAEYKRVEALAAAERARRAATALGTGDPRS